MVTVINIPQLPHSTELSAPDSVVFIAAAALQVALGSGAEHGDALAWTHWRCKLRMC